MIDEQIQQFAAAHDATVVAHSGTTWIVSGPARALVLIQQDDELLVRLTTWQPAGRRQPHSFDRLCLPLGDPRLGETLVRTWESADG